MDTGFGGQVRALLSLIVKALWSLQTAREPQSSRLSRDESSFGQQLAHRAR